MITQYLIQRHNDYDGFVYKPIHHLFLSYIYFTTNAFVKTEIRHSPTSSPHPANTRGERLETTPFDFWTTCPCPIPMVFCPMESVFCVFVPRTINAALSYSGNVHIIDELEVKMTKKSLSYILLSMFCIGCAEATTTQPECETNACGSCGALNHAPEVSPF